MSYPTLSETIANDLAKKCGDDVGAAIRRNMALCDSQGASMMVAVSGAGVAMANVVGALWATDGKNIDAQALDAAWKQLIRPLALSVIGDRKPFLEVCAMLAAKRESIDGAGE